MLLNIILLSKLNLIVLYLYMTKYKKYIIK